MTGMTEEELAQQYRDRAQAEWDAGGSIEINNTANYVSIKMSSGAEYFFQDWEAENLLETVPDWIDEEDYLLAQAQNW